MSKRILRCKFQCHIQTIFSVYVILQAWFYPNIQIYKATIQLFILRIFSNDTTSRGKKDHVYITVHKYSMVCDDFANRIFLSKTRICIYHYGILKTSAWAIPHELLMQNIVGSFRSHYAFRVSLFSCLTAKFEFSKSTFPF